MHWFLKVLLGLAVIFLVSFIILSLPKILAVERISDGQVNGLILRDQVWQGTIRVVGDVYAIPTATVTLKPGTIILVSKNGDKFNFDFLPWHLKSGINTLETDHGVYESEPFWDERQKIQIHFGKLVALGSKEMPIIIKSDSTYGSPYDINVIGVNSGVIANARLSNYRRLEVGSRVVLRDSLITETGECAVCISSGNPTVFNNDFGRSLRESIYIRRASPRITDNIFNNQDGTGIKIDPNRNGTPIISFNNFEMPGRFAVDILTGEEVNAGVISSNKFSGNSKIRIACDSKIKFTGNVLLSLIIFGGSGCGGQYAFGPNYWGSKNIKTILSEQITNKDKKFDVLIPTILDSPPTVVGVRSKQ